MTRRALGKGLAALIPDMPEDFIRRGRSVMDLPVAKIRPSPFQPRVQFDEEGIQELKRSILEKGVIQPVVVRAAEPGYELVVGERRLRAVKAAGIETIPAIVLDVSSPEELMELALVENLQREDLNPMDEARAYQSLAEQYGLTQEEIAEKVGKDRSTVANMMRLLKLPPQVQDRLYDGALSVGHARALLAVDDLGAQVRLCGRIVKEGLSVREVEDLVRKGLLRPGPARRAKQRPAAYVFVEEQLQRVLGTKVRIEKGRRKGRIEIEFYSEEDLERILQVLSGGDRT